MCNSMGMISSESDYTIGGQIYKGTAIPGGLSPCPSRRNGEVENSPWWIEVEDGWLQDPEFMAVLLFTGPAFKLGTIPKGHVESSVVHCCRESFRILSRVPIWLFGVVSKLES